MANYAINLRAGESLDQEVCYQHDAVICHQSVGDPAALRATDVDSGDGHSGCGREFPDVLHDLTRFKALWPKCLQENHSRYDESDRSSYESKQNRVAEKPPSSILPTQEALRRVRSHRHSEIESGQWGQEQYHRNQGAKKVGAP